MNTITKHWVFRARVVHRAGALTSIASVFSNEGINIETIVGHGATQNGALQGSIIVTFQSTEAEKDVLLRKIKRLSKVIDIQVQPYESKDLRKSVIISVSRPLSPENGDNKISLVYHQRLGETLAGWLYFLAGSPNDLDGVMNRLEADIVHHPFKFNPGIDFCISCLMVSIEAQRQLVQA